MNTKHALGREDFLINCHGAFFINMTKESGRYTLHKKNYKRCPYSRYASEYLDFNSIEEIKKANIVYKECMNCFAKGDE